MTSSKVVTEAGVAKSSELPELQQPQHEAEVEDDDEGFQTVVSKRTVRLMHIQQQQQQIRQNSRRYNNGYGGYHGYGNGNGRHYHRQYGPPHGGGSSGTNSNSSASSIPEELPKEKDLDLRQEETHNSNPESTVPTPKPTQPALVSPTTPSPPVIAWARVAAGEKPIKIDIPRSPGNTNTCSSPVSTIDMKPLAISLVASACNGSEDDTPVKAVSGKTNSVPLNPKQQDDKTQAQQQDDQSQSTSPRPQVAQSFVPPPPPSIWKIRAAANSCGQPKSDVAQNSGQTGSGSSAVAVTAKVKVPPTVDIWPSLDDAVKPAPNARPAEVNVVSFTPQTGGTTPSESATDSGNEEILRITGPPELSDEKWPLPLVSNGVGKGFTHVNDAAGGVEEKLRQSRHGSGDAMSSDAAGNGETGEGDSASGDIKKKKKNKKSSKQKWVPLILEDEPPKPPPKPKKRRDKFEQQRGSMSHHNNGGGTGGEANSSESATPTEGLPRTNRGGSGSGTGRGRNGHKGKHRHSYYKFYKETSDPSQLPEENGEGYAADYPPEFAPINPLFPALTEFVMPYTTFATYSPPPDAQAYTYAPIPIDDAVLSQLIQKQIEYYFSEENLDRDFYLRRKMDAEGYIPISLISSFYRIQSMTQDYNVVLNAIRASELIEVKEEDENCAWARPVESPTKWPIVDTAAASIPPPPTIVKSFLTTVTNTATTTATQ